MADVLPKLRMYFFFTTMLVLINVFIFVGKQSTDISDLIATMGFSFVPFAGILIVFVFPNGLPIEILAFSTFVIGIFSGIITYLLVEIIISHTPTVNT